MLDSGFRECQNDAFNVGPGEPAMRSAIAVTVRAAACELVLKALVRSDGPRGVPFTIRQRVYLSPA